MTPSDVLSDYEEKQKRKNTITTVICVNSFSVDHWVKYLDRACQIFWKQAVRDRLCSVMSAQVRSMTATSVLGHTFVFANC